MSCALCDAEDAPQTYTVPPETRSATLSLCAICHAQVAGDQDLDVNHWYCLQGAAWSEEPAVQVVSWRLLQRLSGEAWAAELLDQLYIPDDVLEWAREGQASEEGTPTVDSNGTVLLDGDSVTLIKDLVVKGANFTAKRGTLVKGIRLTDDPRHVEGRVNKTAIVLVAAFLKKAS